MPRKSRIIRLVILCTILCATVLAVLLSLRRPVPANEIVLTPRMLRNEGKLLSIEDGELRGFKEILFSEIPSVGLLAIHRQRNLGGLWTAVTESEYKYLVNLRVTNMDVEYAPQKASGKPDRDYWADKTCEGWPDIKERLTSSYVWSLDPDKLGYPILFKTFDGTTGVFKITETNEDDIHLHYRIIESPAQTAGLETANLNERYIRRLTNGIGIELIGISSNPSGENPWWKPDGRELKRAPYFNISDKHPRKSGQEAYEIASRIVRTADDQLFGRPRIRIPTSLAQAELTTRDEFNSPAFDVSASVFLFTADTASATIEFGLATEKLRTIVIAQNGPRTAQFGSTTIEVSLPEEKDDRMTIDATVPQALIDEYSMLFILVDRDGKRYYLSEHGEAVTGAEPALVKQEWGRHRPHYLRASDIKECRIDFCRYQWIKFKNVSLRPGEDPGFETEAQSL